MCASLDRTRLGAVADMGNLWGRQLDRSLPIDQQQVCFIGDYLKLRDNDTPTPP